MPSEEDKQNHKEQEFRSLGRFVFGSPPDFFKPFLVLDDLSPTPLAGINQVFRGNLQSAFAVGSIPYLLVHTGQVDQRYAAIFAGERIRQLKDDRPDEERERLARAKTNKRIEEELAQTTLIDLLARQTLSVLDYHLNHAEFDVAAAELLSQLIVMSWGAFETLVNDTIRGLLNHHPHLVLNVVKSQKSRDNVFGRDALVEALASSNFDLSSSMGDVFCDWVRLDSFERIREITSIVLQDNELDTSLKSSKLWKASQDRNLIAHRRGIVDGKYARVAAPELAVGSRFSPNTDYVEAVISEVRDIGILLACSANSRFVELEKHKRQQ